MKLKTALATALLAASTYVVPIHANAAGGVHPVLKFFGGWVGGKGIDAYIEGSRKLGYPAFYPPIPGPTSRDRINHGIELNRLLEEARRRARTG